MNTYEVLIEANIDGVVATIYDTVKADSRDQAIKKARQIASSHSDARILEIRRID